MSDIKLKSKMKRADPEDFSIHDFLGECKNSDAADSRFVEENENQVYEFAIAKGHLDPVYTELANGLISRGWNKKKDDTGRYHLILGGTYGKNIPFKRFAQLFKWDYGIVPHCNYYRGYENITKKSNFTQAVRTYEMDVKGEETFEFIPETFMFYPSKPDENEVEPFTCAFESSAKRGSFNYWVVEPVVDGSPSEIFSKRLISNDYDEILRFAQRSGQESLPYAFVVQRYVANPLLHDSSKFECVATVLLDHEYNVHLHRDIKVDVCDAPFSLENVTQMSAHFPKENCSQMSFEQLSKWLSSEQDFTGQDVLKQAKEIIRKTFQVGKKFMKPVEHADFTAFQLFQFRFIVDEEGKVFLASIDAAPKLNRDVVGEVSEAVLDIAVEPLFGGRSSKKSCFTEIMSGTKDALPAALQPRRNSKK